MIILDKKEPYPQNIASYLDTKFDDVTFTGESARQIINEGLSDRERQIIEMRWRDKKTYKEIGAELNVTRERVRQIETRALAKIAYPPNARPHSYVPYQKYVDAMRKLNDAQVVLDWYAENETALAPDEADAADAERRYILNEPIEALNLSVRSYNCLLRYGCATIGDILAIKTEEEFNGIGNFGSKSRSEVLGKIHGLGLRMRWEEPEYV